MSRILIVEDDPAILCGLRDNLELESHQVLTAADGEAGYRAVCDHAPDLMILDCGSKVIMSPLSKVEMSS